MFYKPEKILSTAINRLIRKEPFWARLIASLKIDKVPGNEIRLENLSLLVGEDKILEHSEESTKGDGIITEELETIILGNILKIGLLHILRGKDKEQTLWNAACNIYIARLLSREKYKLPKDVEPIIAEFNLDLSDEETIYAQLAGQTATEMAEMNHEEENSNNQQELEPNQESQQDSNDENTTESPESKPDNESEKTEKGKGKSNNNNGNELGETNTQKPGNNPNTKDENSNTPSNTKTEQASEKINKSLGEMHGENSQGESVDQLKDEQIERIIHQAIMLGQKAGDTPSYLEEKIQNLRKTNFNLRTILEKFVSDSNEPDRYNWLRPDRRYHNSEFLIPQVEGEGISGMCIAFDTSGSCYDVVKRIMGVIYEVNESMYGNDEPINLLYCDCGEVQHQVWKNKSDLPTVRNAGGGTSFAPVMEWVIKENKKHPEKIKNLLYVTDGECSTIGKNPGIPVTWLLLDLFNNAKNAAREISFGKKIIISKEQIRMFMGKQ